MTGTRTAESELRDLSASVEAVLRQSADGPIAFERPGTGAELWSTATRLGWPGIGLDERRGGSGGGLDDLAALLRVLGRWVAPGPFLGTAAAALVLDVCRTKPDGSVDLLTAGVPLATPCRPHPARAGSQLRLLQPPAQTGHAVLVSPRTVSVVRLRAPVTAPPEGPFDPAVPIVEVDADAVAAPVAEVARETVDRALRILLAAHALGIADRMLDVAVEYACQRHQFGRPIGSFQAVKHRCANMAVRQRAALGSVRFALTRSWECAPDADRAAAVACEIATAAAVDNAEDCLETHGAIGHTWEFAGHRFLKRAHVLRGLSTLLARTLAEEASPA